MELISDPPPHGRERGGLRRFGVAFFTFRVVSRISVGSETQARCSIVFLLVFFGGVGLKRWLCYRWDRSVSAEDAGHASGGEHRGLGTFVLFLVQYAVHKSLALQILRFLLISFVVKLVHCCFFSIKSLWTTEMSSCAFSIFCEHFRPHFCSKCSCSSDYLIYFLWYWCSHYLLMMQWFHQCGKITSGGQKLKFLLWGSSVDINIIDLLDVRGLNRPSAAPPKPHLTLNYALREIQTAISSF